MLNNVSDKISNVPTIGVTTEQEAWKSIESALKNKGAVIITEEYDGHSCEGKIKIGKTTYTYEYRKHGVSVGKDSYQAHTLTSPRRITVLSGPHQPYQNTMTHYFSYKKGKNLQIEISPYSELGESINRQLEEILKPFIDEYEAKLEREATLIDSKKNLGLARTVQRPF